MFKVGDRVRVVYGGSWFSGRHGTVHSDCGGMISVKHDDGNFSKWSEESSLKLIDEWRKLGPDEEVREGDVARGNGKEFVLAVDIFGDAYLGDHIGVYSLRNLGFEFYRKGVIDPSTDAPEDVIWGALWELESAWYWRVGKMDNEESICEDCMVSTCIDDPDWPF